MLISIVEGSVPPHLVGGEYAAAKGYGRDTDEVRSHGGWPAVEREEESFRVVEVRDDPDDTDPESKRIAWEVCRFHTTDEDQDTPEEVRAHLASLLQRHLYAESIDYCFTMVWDRGWDEHGVA